MFRCVACPSGRCPAGARLPRWASQHSYYWGGCSRLIVLCSRSPGMSRFGWRHSRSLDKDIDGHLKDSHTLFINLRRIRPSSYLACFHLCICVCKRNVLAKVCSIIDASFHLARIIWRPTKSPQPGISIAHLQFIFANLGCCSHESWVYYARQGVT